MKINSFKELEAAVRAMEEKSTVAVCMAQDEHTLDAIVDAKSQGLINAVLIGDVAKIEELVVHLGGNVADYEIIPAETPEESVAIAAKMVHEGKCHAIMKGKMETGQIMKGVLNKENGLRKGGVISVCAFFQIPTYHKLLAVSDVAISTYPDFDGKKSILENAVDVFHALGHDNPKVGVIAAVEKVNPKMPETVDADALKTMNKNGEIAGCTVEGPISFDLATDPNAAKIKGYDSPVAGDVDILIVPDLICGNVLAKCITGLANGSTAGLVVGAKCPVILTSRSAEASDKFYSICLAACVGKKIAD